MTFTLPCSSYGVSIARPVRSGIDIPGIAVPATFSGSPSISPDPVSMTTIAAFPGWVALGPSWQEGSAMSECDTMRRFRSPTSYECVRDGDSHHPSAGAQGSRVAGGHTPDLTAVVRAVGDDGAVPRPALGVDVMIVVQKPGRSSQPGESHESSQSPSSVELLSGSAAVLAGGSPDPPRLLAGGPVQRDDGRRIDSGQDIHFVVRRSDGGDEFVHIFPIAPRGSGTWSRRRRGITLGALGCGAGGRQEE